MHAFLRVAEVITVTTNSSNRIMRAVLLCSSGHRRYYIPIFYSHRFIAAKNIMYSHSAAQ